MKERLLIILILVGLFGGPFFNVMIRAQDPVVILASKDNTIFSEDSTKSNGAGSYIFAGTTNDWDNRRALVHFRVQGSIPQNTVVDSVILTLVMSRNKLDSAWQVNLHRLNGPWGEAGSDAPGEEGQGILAESGDATWSHSTFNTQTWVNPGGDFDINPSASTIVEGVGSYTWKGSGITEDVKNWLNGSSENHGWILIGQEGEKISSKRFNSRENSESATHPKLTIYYSESTSDKAIAFKAINQVSIFPNPFRDQVIIEYHLQRGTMVECKIYDILGKEISTLVIAYQSAGKHRITWDGTDATGNPVTKGMYYTIFRMGEEKEIIKIMKSH